MQLSTLLHTQITSGASLEQSLLTAVIYNYLYIQAFSNGLQLVMVCQQLFNDDL